MPGRLISENKEALCIGKMERDRLGSNTDVLTAPAGNGTAIKGHGSVDIELLYHVPAVAEQANGNSAFFQESAVLPKALANSLRQLPPEIEHVTLGLLPLSRLLERVAQDCFNGLNELISELADAPRAYQVNGGVATNSTGITTAPSEEKRLRWLNFASRQKDIFIKLIVLVQWSQQMDDIGKLIDLRVWLDKQRDIYVEAQRGVGELKRNLATAKVPNPDIGTALEILSMGKSTIMPDLGYITPSPLPPQKILKTLQDINTLLYIRLNLHEELPQHFRSFTISSGRATFIVPSEFEIDLSIADENPCSQFYFIDFRFLFSPRSEIPAGQLRNSLEARANEVLASDGLVGCFKLLHDFVLTHKINMLRRQAVDMNVTTWAGLLHIEQLHRSLVIQYWVGRPGSKHWIEIGVLSGKRRDGKVSWKGEEQTRLVCRWIRGAKEVKDVVIPLDVAELSLENTLKAVIARHVDYILSHIRNQFSKVTLPGHRPATLNLSSIEPADCALQLPCKGFDSASLVMEVVTGKFSLLPISAATVHCEEHLNRLEDPAIEAFPLLQMWQASERQAAIESNAERWGWQIQALPRLEVASIKRAFGRDTLRTSFFVQYHWDSPWMIASAIGPTGDSWWIAAINDHIAQNIINVVRVPTQDLCDGEDEASQMFYANLEYAAVAMISFFVVQTHLKSLKIPYTFGRPIAEQCTLGLSIDAAALLRKTSPEPNLPGASNILVLTYHGFENKPAPSLAQASPRRIVYIVRGTMNCAFTLPRLLTPGQVPDMEFDKAGAFALVFRTPLGSAVVIEQLVARLNILLQLRIFVNILKSRSFSCNSVSLRKIIFAYAANIDKIKPRLMASVSFADSSGVDVSFSPPHGNCHTRIQSLITRLLNKATSTTTASSITRRDPSGAFKQFIRVLELTLPLLRALDAIDSHDPAAQTVTIHTRSLEAYHVVYKRPRCAFNITYKMRRDEGMWCIKEDLEGHQSSRPESLRKDLQAFFSRNGDGRVGLKGGVAVTSEKVGEVLQQLDEVVRSSAQDEVVTVKVSVESFPQLDGIQEPLRTTLEKRIMDTPAHRPPAATASVTTPPIPKARVRNNTRGKGNGNGNGKSKSNGNGKEPEVVVLD